MTDFLDQVVASRREYVREMKAARRIDEQWVMPRNAWTQRHQTVARGRFFLGGVGNAFDASLRARRNEGRLGVIAEVKRTSPALGVLASSSLDVAVQARAYEAAGATAISVLTEPRFWGGSLDDLRTVREATTLPVLCKDVIVDEHQIFEARAAGADAILLIAEVLSDEELRRFRDRATELEMGTLVEAHEPAAFGRAVATGSMVVGVNARNLRRPQEIDISRARQLHLFARDAQILVAESGIGSVDDARLLPARVDAVLVGTALMREPDPGPLIVALASIARSPRREIVVVKP